MDHDWIVDDWQRNAKAREDASYEFLRSLKFRDYGFEPDELAGQLHQQVFQIVDCSRCANCCKTLDIKVGTADAQQIATHLQMPIQAFTDACLNTDENGDAWLAQQPCPFLGDDDRCQIYELRPVDCRDYPYTDKEGFVFRTIGHANRALTCPAVFWIIGQMRSRCVPRTRKRGRRRRR